MTANLPNGVHTTPKAIQLSFPLPHSLSTRIHLHITNQKHSLLVFVTSVSGEAAAAPAPLGSFVYALPSRDSSSPPLSTPLYTQPQTIDFATRLAKVLARRSGKPTYVGNSASFGDAGRGGDVEEEMGVFRQCVGAVMGVLSDNR